MGVKHRVTTAWNALRGKTEIPDDAGQGYGYPAHKITTMFSASKYANAIINRIAIDASMVDILHVKIDKQSGHEETIMDGICQCLMVEANLDQSAKEFIHDIVYSMFDEGVVAVVPVHTTRNPDITAGYDIETMRTGRIVQWYPKHVKVNLYNEETGRTEDVYLHKRDVAIIENPLYAIINDKNSTLKRLVSKLSLLDLQDSITAGGRLDLILQLPYTIKTESRREDAEKRLSELTNQLNNSKYGIGYIDSADKITQLNRPVVNNLLEQVETLRKELYNQLGLTENVFNGTATEAQMRTYYNRTIDPILTRITNEFERKFLTKTARTQGQKFTFRRDPFKMVPVEQLAQIADTFSRNELLTPNEIRPIIGFGPSKDPEADKLSNRNIADKNKTPPGGRNATTMAQENQNGAKKLEGAN